MGLSLTFILQPSPDGLAQSYLLCEGFLAGAPSVLILGDNIFVGQGLTQMLAEADAQTHGGTVFGYQMSDPERYEVVEFNENGKVVSIIEKPSYPASNFAVTGLYFLDGDAPARARSVRPSARGEMEMTTLLDLDPAEGGPQAHRMGRGYAWLDTGSDSSFLNAGNFARTLEQGQDLQVGSPEEIALENGWIEREALAAQYAKNDYGRHLSGLLSHPGVGV